MIWLFLLGVGAVQGLDKDDERWLEREVAALITREEASIFRGLSNDDDRDLFRDIFWSRRDPDPRTTENEFRHDFERRVAIADERFRARVGPGSQSEMGQLFLLLGFPASIDMGRGSIPLPSNGGIPEGLEGSTTELTPAGQGGGAGRPGSPVDSRSQRIQTWRYPPDEASGFPDGLDVRFRAQPGYGYRLILSEDLERALETRRQSLIAWPEIGYVLENGRLVAPQTDVTDNAANSSLATQILDDLIAGAPVSDELPFDVTVAFFRSFDGAAYMALLVETEQEMTVFGAVTPIGGGTSQRFEHKASEIPLQLAPGDYTVHLGVLDAETPAFGTRVMTLQVPGFEGNGLRMSSIVLYDGAEKSDARAGTPGRAFQFGSVHLSPKGQRPFRSADSLGLFYYVYFPTDRTPELTTRYVFYLDGQERAQTEPKPMLVAEGQALASDEIPLASFSPGEYRVLVQVEDGLTGETLEGRASFTLER
ncbi:MAG TPA: GWxTD domain-containing protein [Vicinamibacteria bacterium]|nr:GWxTD domain-containing protein [Vicinamibacteria bacterium]